MSNFQTFSGAEYLMIDAANAFGLDKKEYEERISWVRKNLDNLEDFILKADEPLLFLKAVQTIRAVQRGEAVGHMVELDATTSGLQIMSALTGCPKGALWTNLINPNKRHDAYSESFAAMKTRLNKTTREITRAMSKQALMTVFYGSNAQPMKIFGADTPELDAFFEMCQKDLRGCWELRTDLIELGQKPSSLHEWTLPDGFLAHVPTKEKLKIQCEIDELEHHKFTHIYEEFGNEITTISLAANVIHSIDGYMVREVSRRVNYDVNEVKEQLELLEVEVALRGLDLAMKCDLSMPLSAKFAIGCSPVEMDDEMVVRSVKLLNGMLQFESAEVVSIHDAYKAHPNACNGTRYWYKELLAEFAESDLLSIIFSEIEGGEVEYENCLGGYKKDELAALIRENANYSLC